MNTKGEKMLTPRADPLEQTYARASDLAQMNGYQPGTFAHEVQTDHQFVQLRRDQIAENPSKWETVV